MTAANHLMHARKSLDALADLLRDAASDKRSADEILKEAMSHLRQARQILDSMTDDEGTE
jgi:hypothetical protein